jgi:putative ABC transport system ATP-binding protein
MTGLPLSVRNLHKTYAGAEHPVFDGFSLEVEAGSLCAVVGPSGVGKTTLLNCVAGLDHWESGSIQAGNQMVPMGQPEASALYRRAHVGLAFQQPHLLPEFTVEENLLMPRPGLWLLDEPTGNLDPATAQEVFEFLLALHAELRPTTLLVTHNLALAERCGRIVRLGTLVAVS